MKQLKQTESLQWKLGYKTKAEAAAVARSNGDLLSPKNCVKPTS
jgi:hypothetical protein